MDLQAVGAHVDLLHFAVLDQLHELVVADPRSRVRTVIHHIAYHDEGDHRREEHDHQILACRSLASVSAVVVAAVPVPASSAVVTAVIVISLDVFVIVFVIIKISKHSFPHSGALLHISLWLSAALRHRQPC